MTLREKLENLYGPPRHTTSDRYVDYFTLRTSFLPVDVDTRWVSVHDTLIGELVWFNKQGKHFGAIARVLSFDPPSSSKIGGGYRGKMTIGWDGRKTTKTVDLYYSIQPVFVLDDSFTKTEWVTERAARNNWEELTKPRDRNNQ